MCPTRALSAAGTIVTPQVGQMGGCSSSTPKVWSRYPHDTEGKKVSAFYNATRSVYERAGFRAAGYWMKRLMMFDVTRCAGRFA